jgi:hypothetical protein
MKELDKDERKLLKRAKKLKKITDKYITGLIEVDEDLRDLSIRTSLAYNLEKDYFDKAPALIRAVTPIQAFADAITEVLDPEEDGLESND